MKRLLALTLLLLLVPVFALAGGLEDQIAKTYIAPNIKGYPTASLPSPATRGQLAFDTTTNELKVYTGSAWAAASSSSLVAGTDYISPDGVESFITGTKTVTSKFDFGGGTLEIPNSTSLPGTCAVGDAYMDTNATSGQRFYLCESANTWALQGDGGGGGGVSDALSLTCTGCTDGNVLFSSGGVVVEGTVDAANKALSNLASVALNTALLPDAAAADDFGSATLPFKDIFFAGSSGTPGTNNFKITGASTSGTRVFTIPNATGTAMVYTGSPANDDCPKFAVSGGVTTVVTSGAACGGAGGTERYTMSVSMPVNNSNGNSLSDSLSYYLGTGSWTNSGAASAATVGIVVPIDSTLTAVCWKVRINATLGTTEDVTLKVNKNAGGATTTGIPLDFDNANRSGCETGLSFSVVQGDYVVGEVVTPAWATNPDAVSITATMIFSVP